MRINISSARTVAIHFAQQTHNGIWFGSQLCQQMHRRALWFLLNLICDHFECTLIFYNTFISKFGPVWVIVLLVRAITAMEHAHNIYNTVRQCSSIASAMHTTAFFLSFFPSLLNHIIAENWSALLLLTAYTRV